MRGRGKEGRARQEEGKWSRGREREVGVGDNAAQEEEGEEYYREK